MSDPIRPGRRRRPTRRIFRPLAACPSGNGLPYAFTLREPTPLEDACARLWADRVMPEPGEFDSEEEWADGYNAEYLGALQSLVGTGYTERYRAQLVEEIVRGLQAAGVQGHPIAVVRSLA